jgi:hypothetical protein
MTSHLKLQFGVCNLVFLLGLGGKYWNSKITSSKRGHSLSLLGMSFAFHIGSRLSIQLKASIMLGVINLN